MNLAYKILDTHLLEGQLKAGEEVLIKIDQTLTQDTTGTMVYLQLEALDITSLKTDLSVAYIDHNTLQLGFENADDHEFIRSIAEKYGIIYSKPGNGICHQVHLEQYSKPGCTLLGSDSHTPTSGGMAAIAIGSGGLDVAVAMAKGYYFMKVPKVYNVHLTGSLQNNASAKDVILTVLKKLTVSGGVGHIIEYTGDGVSSLSTTDRATICNMGAELGATTSVFPSDERTQEFLRQQGRECDYIPLSADQDALYDNRLAIDLNTLKPMVAKPHSPDNVVEITDVEGLKVNQIAIGSCTNSSYSDLMKVAKILDGKHIAPEVSLLISPGSNNIVSMLNENGAINSLIQAGARILEPACGPCIGMGQAPISNGISLRTFNRNFKGRCGTTSADVYLVSPETAAVSAITGILTDPTLFKIDTIKEPKRYHKLEHFTIEYSEFNHMIVPFKGPNIKDFPLKNELNLNYKGQTLLKVGDNISTDAIVPSTSKLLPLRSNIPELAKHCFINTKETFYDIAIASKGGFIIGGENYGQGSSREHAALVPLYLGIEFVIAKSFARIHKRNLINSGIVPFTFKNPEDYNDINENDVLDLKITTVDKNSTVTNNRTLKTYDVEFTGSSRDIEILKAGGYINYEKSN
ncbi:MAG: aconitate hydratase [Clostridiales bacterium]|nr:aconitate hydratase [Clostridiales bacterium]